MTNVESPLQAPPLFEGSVSFSFGVEKEVSGALKVVILKFRDRVTAGDTHTIKFTFKKK